MDFGIFMEFEIRQGGEQASAFREGFDLVDAAEAWGLDGVWLGEMHFTPTRSVLAAPIVVASSIATRTTRLRIGMAVQVLPLNNPLRIAEEAATVDHLGEGRFDFGTGRSGFPRVYDRYGIPYAESQARFREALEIILEAWKGEPFSYAGEHYRFETPRSHPAPISDRTRRSGWPPPPRRRFPGSARWGCRSSSACAGWTSATCGRTCRPTAGRGVRPATRATATSTCAFPSTPRPRSGARGRSRSRASRSTSTGRRVCSRRRWGARGPVPPSVCKPGSISSPRCPTSRSSTSASRSAPPRASSTDWADCRRS